MTSDLCFFHAMDARSKSAVLFQEMSKLLKRARSEKEQRKIADAYVPRLLAATAAGDEALKSWWVALGGIPVPEPEFISKSFEEPKKFGPFDHPERQEGEAFIGDRDLLGAGVFSNSRLGKGFDDGLNEGLERGLRYPVFLSIEEALKLGLIHAADVKNAKANGRLTPREIEAARGLDLIV